MPSTASVQIARDRLTRHRHPGQRRFGFVNGPHPPLQRSSWRVTRGTAWRQWPVGLGRPATFGLSARRRSCFQRTRLPASPPDGKFTPQSLLLGGDLAARDVVRVAIAPRSRRGKSFVAPSNRAKTSNETRLNDRRIVGTGRAGEFTFGVLEGVSDSRGLITLRTAGACGLHTRAASASSRGQSTHHR